MNSTKRLSTPEARARKHLKLGPNTILAIMRHGCSILTATTSRSFIKAELIFIVRASRVSNSGRDSPFRSVLRLSANFTDGHWNCAKGVVSAIARQWPVAGFCPVSCSAKALKADGPRGFAPQKSATSESSQRDHTDVLV